MTPKYGEPWSYGLENDIAAIWNTESMPIIASHFNGKTRHRPIEIHLARIVLCVNACSGLSDSEVAEMRRLYDERRK